MSPNHTGFNVGDIVRPRDPENGESWSGKVLTVSSRAGYVVDGELHTVDLGEPHSSVKIVEGAGAGEPWGYRMDKAANLVRSRRS